MHSARKCALRLETFIMERFEGVKIIINFEGNNIPKFENKTKRDG